MTVTRIFVVTPCFNAGQTIDQTIASVLNQAGPFDLHYHVQDGGSTDDTVSRLKVWAERLAAGGAPGFCNSVTFTFESVQDSGMYDAIARGFASFDTKEMDWLTWINADDMLAPGSCALMAKIDGHEARDAISWVSGAVSIVSEGTIVSYRERPLAAKVIRLGLCDGKHWEFIQQEGTFFRAWLWKSINVKSEFTSLRLAGDWNLWRKFAGLTELYQVPQTLGLFHLREGQLSQAQRQAYLEEIDSLVPEEERTRGMISLIGKPIIQKRLDGSYAKRSFEVSDRDLNDVLKQNLATRFGNGQARYIEQNLERVLYAIEEELILSKLPGPRTDMIAHDADWQFPAITELHAFRKAKEFLPLVGGICYLAFPWATLIDQVANWVDKTRGLGDVLRELPVAERGADRVVTVCQHILMRNFAYLLIDAGVTDVFWTHAVEGEEEISAADGRTLRVHPFPLYPVQAIGIDREALGGERRHLFSFIGAKSDEWYLTRSREWIIEKLSTHPRGYVVGRDAWHYQKIVYDHQIKGIATETANLVDDEAGRAFRQVLLSSVFALCPSGSGPNSIRLWEAIGAGSIPVILSDTYKVPGNPELWKHAAVFCRETPEDIAELPARLEAIAADSELLASMRTHLEQLWMLYGPDTFVTDIHRFYIDVAGERHAALETGPPLSSLAERINAGELATHGGLETFLKLCAGRLVLDPEGFGTEVNKDRALRSACEYALLNCQDKELVTRVSSGWTAAGLALPEDEAGRTRRPVPVRRHRIHLFGRHSNRTPMHYEPYRRLFERHVDYVDDIWKADTVVTGFDIDIRSATAELAQKTSIRPEMQFLVVSEEPLWDTVWSAVLAETSGLAGSGADIIPYSVANHVNSDVFTFEKLPYFITTDDRFFQRYARQFQRNAAMSADEVLAIWRDAPVRAAFYAERRLDDRFDLFRPELAVRGLCAWRTRIAEGTKRGPLVRVGQGWNPNAARRQGLADWHLDKLSALDRHALIVSGLENTHQPDYITEKPFDAFAVLGVPLYYADPRHRIHEICPSGGFLNLYGHSEEEAVALIDAFEPDAAFARAYLDTQKALASLFSDPETLNRERARVVSAALGVLQR